MLRLFEILSRSSSGVDVAPHHPHGGGEQFDGSGEERVFQAIGSALEEAHPLASQA